MRDQDLKIGRETDQCQPCVWAKIAAVAALSVICPATATIAATDGDSIELSSEGRQYAAAFERAANEFNVPVELLQAIAFVKSRWVHRIPTGEERDNHGNPDSYGIMGLRDDSLFGHSLREAARLIGKTPDELMLDVELNIRGAAALLSHYHEHSGDNASSSDLEEWEPAVARLNGIPQQDISQIHTYDVFESIRRGRQGESYRIRQRELDFDSIYGSARLRVLAAPQMTIDGARDDSQPAGMPTIGIQSTDYGPALFDPAPSCNFTSGRSSAITHVTIHMTQETYADTIALFKNCNSRQVSAHYVIRSSDGQITQMVRERDTAHHARSANGFTVGIEHEGFIDNPVWFTDAMYDASARLTRNICDKHGIDESTTYDGDFQGVISDDFRVKGHVHFAGQIDRFDPGPLWDWPRYKALVTR